MRYIDGIVLHPWDVILQSPALLGQTTFGLGRVTENDITGKACSDNGPADHARGKCSSYSLAG
jgi:hypothetical protein